MLRHLLILLILSISTSAQAQTFSVRLGGTILGQISYGGNTTSATLRTTLDNTPLGVFDGTFNATSRQAGGLQAYDSLSASSRKTRHIQIALEAGRAVETLVDPDSEMTVLSDPTRVPAGVVDPVMGLGTLIRAETCPAQFVIYDGRRAIALIPTEAITEGTLQTCAIAYRVIAGPGHLSPLKITNAKMKLTYLTTGGTRALARIELISGIFRLVLDRVD